MSTVITRAREIFMSDTGDRSKVGDKVIESRQVPWMFNTETFVDDPSRILALFVVTDEKGSVFKDFKMMGIAAFSRDASIGEIFFNLLAIRFGRIGPRLDRT